MNKLFTLLSTLLIINELQAQITDSVTIGTGGTDMVFYSLKTRTQTRSSNTDWHLAFSCKPAAFPTQTNQSASIRINGAYGLELYRCPNQKTPVFATLDTTGYQGWQRMQNPDTSWDIGAFNINKDQSQPFNYGWGSYTISNHAITSDSSIYLLKLPNGSFKKFAIINLAFDTAFNIQYSNLDNSRPITLEIRKKPYKNRNFIYLNLLNDSLMNKEPLSTNWDLVFLKYNNNQVTADAVRDMGIFTNYYTTTTLTDQTVLNTCQNTIDSNASSQISIIGKSFRTSPSLDVVYPTRVYTITPYASSPYALHVSQFTGATGQLIFTRCASILGVNDAVTTNASVSIYPVPASQHLSIDYTSDAASALSLQLCDLTGRVLLTQSRGVSTGMQHHDLDLSSLSAGQYILSGYSSSGSWHRAIVVAH
jgi:Secretion system C-terminal sorting domain/HmuY protein